MRSPYGAKPRATRAQPAPAWAGAGSGCRDPLTGLNLVQHGWGRIDDIPCWTWSQSPYGAKPRATLLEKEGEGTDVPVESQSPYGAKPRATVRNCPPGITKAPYSRNPLTGLNLVQQELAVLTGLSYQTIVSQSPYGAKPRATEKGFALPLPLHSRNPLTGLNLVQRDLADLAGVAHLLVAIPLRG